MHLFLWRAFFDFRVRRPPMFALGRVWFDIYMHRYRSYEAIELNITELADVQHKLKQHTTLTRIKSMR